MVAGAKAVDEAQTQIDGLLRSLDSQLAELTSAAQWKGQAQAAFGTLFTNWRTQQDKLRAALVDMHGALVATNQTYIAQEESESSAFSNIASAL